MSKAPLRPALALLLLPASALLLPAGCGARTGLDEQDAGPDAFLLDDDPDAGRDAGPDAPGPACLLDADCIDVLDLCNPVGCLQGKCTPLKPVVCDDKDPCTADSCDPATGKCAFDPLTFDLDKDGFKGPRPGTKAGDPGSCGDDCDDTSPLAYPGGKELCDGVDNDCNGIIDDEAKFIPVNADPILISDIALNKAYASGIAYSGPKQGYLASYTGEASSNSDIYTRPLDPLGQPKGTVSKVNGTTGDAIGGPMVWTGDRHGMAWADRRSGDYEIYFNTFAPDGPKLGPDVALTSADGFSINPSIAWSGTSFFVVWQDDSSGSFEIFAQKISLDAKLVGDQLTLASPSGFEQNAEAPYIAASSQGIAVVHRLGDSFSSAIKFRPYDDQLAPTAAEVTLASGENFIDPTIVANGSTFVVAWGQKQPFKVFGAVLDLKGQIVVPVTELSPPEPGAFRHPLILPLGDRIIVTYSQQNSDGYELFSRTFSKNLAPLSPQQQLTKHIGDDFGQAMVFGPDGDVAVLFDGKISDSKGLRNGAFLTRLRCDAGKL